MVSEFMLQQTPVSRVLPVYEQWLARWPRPADLAKDAPGEAVRAWGRLGYPRRALRLHGAATAITERHGGDVPTDHAQLLALPGIGEYTAAAVASFAYGQRHAVLDTNVRRVFARAVTGVQYPRTPPPPPSASSPAPSSPGRADGRPLGRRVHGTRRTGLHGEERETCHRCPISAQCAWNLAGKPEHDGPARRGQTYAGTDRQVRGKLLAVLREAAADTPSRSRRSTRCGTSRCSGPGRWTVWCRTAWWNPSRTASTGCPRPAPDTRSIHRLAPHPGEHHSPHPALVTLPWAPNHPVPPLNTPPPYPVPTSVTQPTDSRALSAGCSAQCRDNRSVASFVCRRPAAQQQRTTGSRRVGNGDGGG